MPGLQILFGMIPLFLVLLFIGFVICFFLESASCGGRLFQLVGVLVCAFVVSNLMAVKSVRRTHQGYWEKACYAGMRVVLGGIEMYNLDYATTPIHFTNQPVPFDLLLESKILISSPNCGANDYLKDGLPGKYYLVPAGSNSADPSIGDVFCTKHGKLEP